MFGARRLTRRRYLPGRCGTKALLQPVPARIMSGSLALRWLQRCWWRWRSIPVPKHLPDLPRRAPQPSRKVPARPTASPRTVSRQTAAQRKWRWGRECRHRALHRQRVGQIRASRPPGIRPSKSENSTSRLRPMEPFAPARIRREALSPSRARARAGSIRVMRRWRRADQPRRARKA